jgi:hypothetical protein
MIMRHVVDTNVPIVANGGPRSRTVERIASPECRIKAIEFLELLVAWGIVSFKLCSIAHQRASSWAKQKASLTIFRTIQTSRPSIEAIENS